MKYIIDISEGHKHALEMGTIQNGSIASKIILNAVKEGIPYPHGEWIYNEGDIEFGVPPSNECSECGYNEDEHLHPNFCPYCGADMRGNKE